VSAGLASGIATVLAFAAFAGVVAWAYSRRRRETYDEAARRPLEEDPS
jgi:cytochrome c oxidase cbb3-type subunit 4